MSMRIRMNTKHDPKAKEHNHCWHRTGRSASLASGEEAYELKCCWCGQYCYTTDPKEYVNQHGPHHKQPNKELGGKEHK